MFDCDDDFVMCWFGNCNVLIKIYIIKSYDNCNIWYNIYEIICLKIEEVFVIR